MDARRSRWLLMELASPSEGNRRAAEKWYTGERFRNVTATGLATMTLSNPTFTGCTDNVGGTDTVTTNSTNGHWTARLIDTLNDETAEALHVSRDTVKRDWKMAKLWLLRELRGVEPDDV